MKNNKTYSLPELQRDAYEAFKLHWLISHGYTAADLLAKYSEYWGEVQSDEEGMYDFWNWLDETGFNGEIWPCFKEFLNCEFRDVHLMYRLLSADQYGFYLSQLGWIMSEDECPAKPQCHAEEDSQDMKQLWFRAGVNLSLTCEEANAILATGASAEAIEQTVKKIILEGRYNFSGESYIPQPCVEQYNAAHGTNFNADDIDFEVNIDPASEMQGPVTGGYEAEDDTDADCDGECVGCERACADRIAVEEGAV